MTITRLNDTECKWTWSHRPENRNNNNTADTKYIVYMTIAGVNINYMLSVQHDRQASEPSTHTDVLIDYKDSAASTKTSDKKDLQPLTLDPFERGRVPLLPDALDQCIPTGVHDFLKGSLPLLTDSDVFPYIDMCLFF